MKNFFKTTFIILFSVFICLPIRTFAIPTPPDGLNPINGKVFPANETLITLSWGQVTGAGAYAIRVSDLTEPNARDARNNCSLSEEYLCIDGLAIPNISISVKAGHKYTWWVHAISNGEWSVQSVSNFSVAANTETINTLDYFVSKHPEQSLDGTHPLSSKVSGNKLYYLKWDSTAFEIYKWDDNYIYLLEDYGANPHYTFSPGYWLKRQMQIGDTINSANNYITNYSSSCNILSFYAFPYTITLEEHDSAMDFGGDIGKQDTIVLKYSYNSAVGASIYEKSYYTKEWGWVKWEQYNDNNQVIATSLFNKISNKPILPGASCIETNNAKIEVLNPINNLAIGQKYTINIAVTNTGSREWSTSLKYILGNHTMSSSWVIDWSTLSDQESILPNQTKIFTLNIIAPNTEGQYIINWQMLQDTVTWFGQETKLNVNVISLVTTTTTTTRPTTTTLTPSIATVGQLQVILNGLITQLKTLILAAIGRGEVLSPALMAYVKDMPPVGRITRDWFIGQSGDEVTIIQTYLARDINIYPEGKITGYFGALTKAAVRRFQTKYGINPVGSIDSLTRARLNVLLEE